jgi:glutaconate CoA-transferase, subunit A
MAEIVSLAEAVERAIHDGDAVAMEGFTHLIPFAAGHEVIRQRRRELTLIRMTPDLIYDQLIGAGCARKLIFSWGGNPGVGSLHRFRDAVEHSWPVPLEIEEHSHAGMANRYVAGASGLPFAVLRGYNGTGLETLNDLPGGARGSRLPRSQQSHGSEPTIKPITCPFTGETLTAVSAIRPDVAVIHAQRADRSGNVQLWGITGVQKEVVLASERSVITVEEIVDELDPRPGAVVLPGWTVTFVARAPGGAHPSYALGYSVRDNDYYVAWDAIARERATFTRWLGELCSPGGTSPPDPPATGGTHPPRPPLSPLRGAI